MKKRMKKGINITPKFTIFFLQNVKFENAQETHQKIDKKNQQKKNINTHEKVKL